MYYARLIWSVCILYRIFKKKSWPDHGSITPYLQSSHVFPIFQCSMLNIKKFVWFREKVIHLWPFRAKSGPKWTKIYFCSFVTEKQPLLEISHLVEFDSLNWFLNHFKKNLMRCFRPFFQRKRFFFRPKIGYFGPQHRSSNFFQNFGLVTFEYLLYLTSWKKSEESNEWVFRYIDFLRWSISC